MSYFSLFVNIFGYPTGIIKCGILSELFAPGSLYSGTTAPAAYFSTSLLRLLSAVTIFSSSILIWYPLPEYIKCMFFSPKSDFNVSIKLFTISSASERQISHTLSQLHDLIGKSFASTSNTYSALFHPSRLFGSL